ncbi:MAG: hypothetical protein JXB49_30275 [Bacteroidales bacterium]|nr:hypothetical protein [Bacteroidales bacterium]
MRHILIDSFILVIFLFAFANATVGVGTVRWIQAQRNDSSDIDTLKFTLNGSDNCGKQFYVISEDESVKMDFLAMLLYAKKNLIEIELLDYTQIGSSVYYLAHKINLETGVKGF